MILIDSSVWIDLFRSKTNEQTNKLRSYIEQEEDLCTCGLIVTEVLQGIREDAFFHKIEKYFHGLVSLPLENKIFSNAAQIYRVARKRGTTIRSSVDCIIAACAIEHGVAILQRDRDYRAIARYSKLKLL